MCELTPSAGCSSAGEAGWCGCGWIGPGSKRGRVFEAPAFVSRRTLACRYRDLVALEDSGQQCDRWDNGLVKKLLCAPAKRGSPAVWKVARPPGRSRPIGPHPPQYFSKGRECEQRYLPKVKLYEYQ